MHDLTMWRGGDAHFHCNLTRRTGVGGGATPDLESAQWAVQSMRKAMDESKDRLAFFLAQVGGSGAARGKVLAWLAPPGARG